MIWSDSAIYRLFDANNVWFIGHVFIIKTGLLIPTSKQQARDGDDFLPFLNYAIRHCTSYVNVLSKSKRISLLLHRPGMETAVSLTSLAV